MHYVYRLTDLETQQSREVMQFHYTTWPDFGIPSSPNAFLKFLQQVRDSDCLSRDVGPAVVHCSAGIGRSGTFCLVDCCLVLIDKYGECNVSKVLCELRSYRMGLIQTADQLDFSYQAIIEGITKLHDPVCMRDERPASGSRFLRGCQVPPFTLEISPVLGVSQKSLETVTSLSGEIVHILCVRHRVSGDFISCLLFSILYGFQWNLINHNYMICYDTCLVFVFNFHPFSVLV